MTSMVTGSCPDPIIWQNIGMPGRQKSINAKIIEYACDCEGGVYRLMMQSPYTTDCRHTLAVAVEILH